MPDSTKQTDTTDALIEWRVKAAGLVAVLCIFLLLWPDGRNKSDTSAVQDDGGDKGRDTLIESLKPTSSATQVTWQVFSETGALSYEVHARAIKQYQSLQLMRIEQPLIRMNSEQQRPWLIQAQQGEISRALNADTSDMPTARATGSARQCANHPRSKRSKTRLEPLYPSIEHFSGTAASGN